MYVLDRHKWEISNPKAVYLRDGPGCEMNREVGPEDIGVAELLLAVSQSGETTLVASFNVFNTRQEALDAMEYELDWRMQELQAEREKEHREE